MLGNIAQLGRVLSQNTMKRDSAISHVFDLGDYASFSALLVINTFAQPRCWQIKDI
jgi:hypothetical protein